MSLDAHHSLMYIDVYTCNIVHVASLHHGRQGRMTVGWPESPCRPASKSWPPPPRSLPSVGTWLTSRGGAAAGSRTFDVCTRKEPALKHNRRPSISSIRLRVVCLMLLALLSGVSAQSAAAATTPRIYDADFWISKLECFNAEEDDFFSNGDEIYGGYVLSEVAPDGSLVKSKAGGFGVFGGFEEGDTKTVGSFPKLRLDGVLSTNRLTVDVDLLEEDGSKGKNYVKAVNSNGNKAYNFVTKGNKQWYVKGGAKFVQWYFQGPIDLALYGWSLDSDDRLGFSESGVHQLPNPPHGTIRKTLSTKGRNNGNHYEYRISYNINLMNP